MRQPHHDEEGVMAYALVKELIGLLVAKQMITGTEAQTLANGAANELGMNYRAIAKESAVLLAQFAPTLHKPV